MAISKTVFRALKKIGGVHGNVLMLGRQHDCTRKVPLAQRTFAEPLFIQLGASMVDSMDVSPAECPTIIHDLNQPVGERLHDRFDYIFDGGTLEHVYDLPAALDNVARMLKRGGVFVSAQNLNVCGHGFYTLSPELFEAWSRHNGFRYPHSFAHYLWFPWLFKLPLTPLRQRTELFSFLPAGFIFSAHKVSDGIGGTPAQGEPDLKSSPLAYWFRRTNIMGRAAPA